MTVGHLTSTMTSIEFEEWKAYYNLLDDEAKQAALARRAQEGIEAQRRNLRRK